MAQEFLDHTTPSAPAKEASLLLLDVAATPPPAEEGSRLLQLQSAPEFLKTHSITESLSSPGQAGDGDDQLGRFDGLGNVNLKT